MILGRNRVPYAGPPQANPNFRPGMPHTRFLTNINPFSNVHRRMAAYSPFHPATMPMPIGPAPSVPAPPPTPVTPAAANSPIGPSGVSGFGFGSTGGTKMHMHVGSPYRTMRVGLIPGIHASGRHLRAGVHHAGALVQHQYPFQMAPLPPPPPPPPPVPTSIKGLMGALFGAGPHHHHARKHRWWQLTPPSTEEQTVAAQTGCETYPPRADGIKVTVCNGRVTKYEDAQGNVQTPGDYGAYPEMNTNTAGIGFPGGWGNRGGNGWGARGGGGWGQRGGFQPGMQPGIQAQPGGGFPHRRRHHWWERQQPLPYVPPTPAPAFGAHHHHRRHHHPAIQGW